MSSSTSLVDMNKQLTTSISFTNPPLNLLFLLPQAPGEYLFSYPGGSMERKEFEVSFRNLALRFFVDKSRHQLLPTNSMRLRCLAQIDNFFAAHRETNRIVNIKKSQFDSLNQKLTKQSSGGAPTTSQFFSSPIVVVLCLVFVHSSIVSDVLGGEELRRTTRWR